jgi:hypothetical protein
MNSLERALHDQLKVWLITEQLPSGRRMTDEEWWQAHHVDDVLIGAERLWHPDRRLAGRDIPRPRLARLHGDRRTGLPGNRRTGGTVHEVAEAFGVPPDMIGDPS